MVQSWIFFHCLFWNPSFRIQYVHPRAEPWKRSREQSEVGLCMSTATVCQSAAHPLSLGWGGLGALRGLGVGWEGGSMGRGSLPQGTSPYTSTIHISILQRQRWQKIVSYDLGRMRSFHNQLDQSRFWSEIDQFIYNSINRRVPGYLLCNYCCNNDSKI